MAHDGFRAMTRATDLSQTLFDWLSDRSCDGHVTSELAKGEFWETKSVTDNR